jgi:AraC-like DNA-binding protein
MTSVAHEPPEPARVLIRAMLAAAMEQAKLPGWFDRYPLQMASPAARQVIWSLGRRLSMNPDVGLVMAERVPAEAVGSLWSMYQVAPSLRVLNRSYNEWSALLLEYMDMQVVEDGALTWFRLVARDGTDADRAEQDFRVTAMVKGFRQLLRKPDLSPRAVHFTYEAPRSLRAYPRALGTDQVRFSQPHLQVGVSHEVADAPLPGSDPGEFERRVRAASALAQEPPPITFAARVDELVTERLARGASEHTVARALGVSVRSLRRRLSEQGASFRAVLDRARQREGDLLLEDVELPIARVARLLGFANDGALRNSMRRWTSLNPGERRSALTRAVESPRHDVELLAHEP